MDMRTDAYLANVIMMQVKTRKNSSKHKTQKIHFREFKNVILEWKSVVFFIVLKVVSAGRGIAISGVKRQMLIAGNEGVKVFLYTGSH